MYQALFSPPTHEPGNEAKDKPALLTALLRMPSGCGQVACVATVGVGESTRRIDSIAEGSTRLLKDRLNC